MIEISKILLIFPIFLIFIFVPFPIFDKMKNKLNIELLNFNLIINCNILLVLSLINFKIKDYQLFLFILYVSIFTYYLLKSKKKILIISNDLIIVFFSFFIFGCVIANNLDLGWDAKYFYYIKSLFFYEGLYISDLSQFEHNKWHPHLGSYFWAFFWSIPFFDIEYFGRLFYLFIFCFAIYFITFNSGKTLLINRILFFSLLLITFNYERFSGLQEIILFSFLMISSKILYDLKITNKIFSISAILLITNLLLWVKSEGIVYGFFITTILIINRNINFKEKLLILLIFIFLVSFKSFVFNYYSFELTAQPYNLAFIEQIDFNQFIHRLKNLVIYGGYYSLKNILFLVSLIIIIKLKFSKNKKINTNNFLVYFILNVSFIFFAYILRDMEIIYSLKTTLERIIFTSSAFYIYLIILYINYKIKIN